MENKTISSSPAFISPESQVQFLQGQLEIWNKIRDGEKTWDDLNEFRALFGYPEVNTDSLRRSFQSLGVYYDAGWIKPVDPIEKTPVFTNEHESISVDFSKQETTSEKIVDLDEQDIRDPNKLLVAHGFDPKNWIIVRANNSRTHKYSASADISCYSSRITVRPKNANEISYDDIDRFFEKFNPSNTVSINPKQYDPDGEFLEVCIQDLHMGELAYAQEAGEDYDTSIARKRLENCVADIFERAKGRKFKRVVLALLGDILHVDNLEGTTTKGTRQDVDTRPTKIFDETLDMLIKTIELLGSIAPVTVVNIPGNHDKFSSYMLCKSMEMAFRGDDKVVFLNDPNPRKWVRFGNVLIGYAHGDMKPNAVTEWLSNECPEWSLAKYREVHLGHLHSLQTMKKIEDNKYGLIARYLPALCSSSAWEHSMGFPNSQRGMMSFVWHEDKGLREVWYSNI